MPVVAVIGAQWGDEGKGKVVDLLAEKAQVVARFSGGDNAGHTVINQLGEFRMCLVPCGIFHGDTLCLIGNGVVIDPVVLLDEMETLTKRNVSIDKLVISERAHLTMPYHILLERLEENARGSAAIGTTQRGIGPTYVDKVARSGIRAGDLLDTKGLKSRLEIVLNQKNDLLTKLYGASPLSMEEVYRKCCQYSERLAPYIGDTEALAHEALARGEFVLLEGAQGTMLDIDFGTYPYVTSSSRSAGGACTGLGLSPTQIDRIVGVFKAFTSRVGAGPMVTELQDETGDLIRERGQEYGTVTRRPRRCGWFDAVAGRFSARVNGFTGVALTRLDVLDAFPALKICTAYTVDGVVCDRFPSSVDTLERCEPVYEELAGWQTPIGDIRTFDGLPPAAKAYVRRLEELIGCPIDLISVGARREQSIFVRPIL